MHRKSLLLLLTFILLLSAFASAKDAPAVVIEWPENKPLFRFTINSFKQIGAFGGQMNFAVETEVTNLSGKKISHATFNFFLFDKGKVRIGQGYIDLSNMAPGETIKTIINALTIGKPTAMSVSAQSLPPELAGAAPPKAIALTVYSVPSGANLKVDGKAAGVTPIALNLVPGSHKLEFSKEGFSDGTFPLMISPDQLPGGSVTFELGSAAHDTIELRDGTLISGDLQSVGPTDVIVMIAGQPKSFGRNQVKRILLIERQTQ